MTAKTSLENYLQEQGFFTYHFHGTSMLPILRECRHDLVTIRAKRPDERCRKYDVALYKPTGGKERYILHRIVEVTNDGYTFLGDNCFSKEYGIKENQVLGIMTEFHRQGATCRVEETWYKLYSRIWVWMYPLRRVLRAALHFAKRKIRGN